MCIGRCIGRGYRTMVIGIVCRQACVCGSSMLCLREHLTRQRFNVCLKLIGESVLENT